MTAVVDRSRVDTSSTPLNVVSELALQAQPVFNFRVTESFPFEPQFGYRFQQIEPASGTPEDASTLPIVDRPVGFQETRARLSFGEVKRWISRGSVSVLLESLQGMIEQEPSRSSTRRIGVVHRGTGNRDDWRGRSEKIDSFHTLQTGWNGYSAPAPSGAAIKTAKLFLAQLQSKDLRPDRIKPAAVGGIGVTFRKDRRKSYVEFYNNGTVYVLFSEGTPEPETRQIRPTIRDYLSAIEEIQGYLNG